MTYSLLRFAHLVGMILIGAGLIRVWISDLRARQVRDLALFGESVRSIAVFYDGVVVMALSYCSSVEPDDMGHVGRMELHSASLALWA